MEDYKPNSHRYKEEQKQAASEDKRVSKVVKGTAKVKKKSEISKFADVFIAEDFNSVKAFVLTDVLIPGIKKVIHDMLSEGIDMMFGTGRSSRTSSGSKVSYRSYYDRRDEDRRSYDAQKNSPRFDHEDIVFESRGEAEGVLDEMQNVIDDYHFVSVADLYEMAGLDQPYTSNKFGWDDIHTARAVRISGGYVLRLPRIKPRN